MVSLCFIILLVLYIWLGFAVDNDRMNPRRRRRSVDSDDNSDDEKIGFSPHDRACQELRDLQVRLNCLFMFGMFKFEFFIH